MIYPGYPLGHAHVIRILCFKQEFEQPAMRRARNAPAFSRQAAVGRNREADPYFRPRSTAGNLRAGKGRLGRSKYGANQVIVEEGGPQG